MTKAHIVLGRDLSTKDLGIINHYRKLEFNSDNPIAPIQGNDDWQKPYFLLRDQDKLVAFGRLHSIDIEFCGTRYKILGIATVIAIVKHSGYGQDLMHEMKKYIQDSGKTAIGFCDPKVSGFYDKCGYALLKDGKSHFVFVDDDEIFSSPHSQDYALYLNGKDNLMQTVLNHPKELITAYRRAW